MDPVSQIPYCPLPPETGSDLVQLGVVLGVFLGAGWLLRRRKRKRNAGKGKE